MKRSVIASTLGVLTLAIATIAACGGSDDDSSATSTNDAGSPATDSASSTDALTDRTGPPDANQPDSGVDPCAGALFCETFDTYGAVATIADKQKFGPWTAALKTGATMKLDGAHTTSGSNALHVHVDDAATAGGRLYAYASGGQPIFKGKPTHVYGRMKMYIDPNGSSIHWTFFGIDGPAATTADGGAGRGASYIMSSLPKSNVNTYSFVYGLAQTPTDNFHDCSSQSKTSMPPKAWTCVSFEMDSVARKLRMYEGNVAAPILSIDDHGANCVAPTPVADPWYGPTLDDLFVGAWSFHPMNGALDVWIDDLVVDTKPVACP